METIIARWKLPIIRWSLRQLTPLLPALSDCTFETLAKFGIDDMHKNEHTGEYAIYPSSDKYKPEPLD